MMRAANLLAAAGAIALTLTIVSASPAEAHFRPHGPHPGFSPPWPHPRPWFAPRPWFPPRRAFLPPPVFATPPPPHPAVYAPPPPHAYAAAPAYAYGRRPARKHRAVRPVRKKPACTCK